MMGIHLLAIFVMSSLRTSVEVQCCIKYHIDSQRYTKPSVARLSVFSYYMIDTEGCAVQVSSKWIPVCGEVMEGVWV